MTKLEFATNVAEEVKKLLGDGFDITIRTVLKNNMSCTGVCIKSEDSIIAPTIYLEDFFEEHQRGRDIVDIAECIVNIYEDHKNPDVDVNGFTDWGWVKERVFYKLINVKNNSQLLDECPHQVKMDLAMIYCVNMGTSPNRSMTVTIRNEHLNIWGITEETLNKIAVSNTPLMFKGEVIEMNNILQSLGTPLTEEEDVVPMYVISNEARVNGAAVIFYPGLLENLAEKLESDLYILPSSIHEVIALPISSLETDSVEDLREMVSCVNNTELAASEILSYAVYRYNRNGELKIA